MKKKIKNDLKKNKNNENDYFLYLLEVDLKYPEEIHNFHNDYPLAPERLKIYKTEKVINNLKNKKNMVYNIYL